MARFSVILWASLKLPPPNPRPGTLLAELHQNQNSKLSKEVFSMPILVKLVVLGMISEYHTLFER